MPKTTEISQITVKDRIEKSIEGQKPSWRNFLSRKFIGERSSGTSSEHERLKPIDYFSRMIERVEEYLFSDDISYEGYTMEVISVFRDAPRDVLTSIVKDYFQYDKDLALEAINTVAAVDKELCCLLVDPGIALRVSEFAQFASARKGLDSIKMRQEFIASFPPKTFFRALKFEPGGKLQPNSQLARDIRRIKEMSIDEYVQYLRDDLQWVVDNYGSTSQVDHFEIPFFSRFSERARRHVGNSDTNSQFISVSKFPQVSWYAVADNGTRVSDNWSDGTSVVIYSFEMNSYYAFSRNIFFDSSYDGVIKIQVGDFEVDAHNGDVEYLIPIGLPSNFYAHSQTYTKHDGQMPLPQ